MEKTIEIINRLKDLGLIEKYAVGGSIATLFYVEPTVTYDLDIMILLSEVKNTLDPLRDIFEWAKQNKYEFIKEHIIIEGIPVQFILAYNDLVIEAVHNSVLLEYKNIPVYVIDKEYQIAIMLNTFRPIDRERIIRFFKEADINIDYLNKILTKFHLDEKMKTFQDKYLNE